MRKTKERQQTMLAAGDQPPMLFVFTTGVQHRKLSASSCNNARGFVISL